MSKGIDCDVFQDQLDALESGELREVGAALRQHAAQCADCAMLLRLHEHLTASRREELEAAVPDDLVASMWRDVQAEIATRRSRRAWKSGGAGSRNWLVPAMAAAVVALLIGVGFLYGELLRLQQRERLLVQQVTEQQGRLAEPDLGTATGPIARTASLVGKRRWERMLARRERVTLAELRRLIARLPAGSTVYGRAEFERLIAGAPFWITSAWRGVLIEIETDDGIQAGELLQLLESMAVDSDRSIPTSRILSYSRSEGRS